jgi:hypothetical protein
MSGLLDRIYQIKNPGVPRYANTDLYRANNNLPLDGESHERYIATKAPIRKNKEYRGRFRSYSFGYPVRYKITLDIQKRCLHEALVQFRRCDVK